MHVTLHHPCPMLHIRFPHQIFSVHGIICQPLQANFPCHRGPPLIILKNPWMASMGRRWEVPRSHRWCRILRPRWGRRWVLWHILSCQSTTREFPYRWNRNPRCEPLWLPHRLRWSRCLCQPLTWRMIRLARKNLLSPRCLGNLISWLLLGQKPLVRHRRGSWCPWCRWWWWCHLLD